MLNPKLAVLFRDEWVDLYRHAGIDLIARMAPEGEEAYRALIAHLVGDRGENPG